MFVPNIAWDIHISLNSHCLFEIGVWLCHTFYLATLRQVAKWIWQREEITRRDHEAMVSWRVESICRSWRSWGKWRGQELLKVFWGLWVVVFCFLSYWNKIQDYLLKWVWLLSYVSLNMAPFLRLNHSSECDILSSLHRVVLPQSSFWDDLFMKNYSRENMIAL